MDYLSELRRRFNANEFTEARKTPAPSPSGPDSFWVELFHEVYIASHKEGRDDLLFYVRWDTKQKCEAVEVLRKDSKCLPDRTDDTILWDKTFYLNFILHEFEYHVTCATVTVKHSSDKISEVKRRIIQQVYPSPNQRRMDKKGKMSDMAYPHITFSVDNFEEVFNDLHTKSPGEKVAVQLLARNKVAMVNQLVFLGAVDHITLRGACETKEQVTLSAKLKRLSLKPRNSRIYSFSQSYRFIQMRGPKLKGFAEMAVLKHHLTKSLHQGTFTYTNDATSDPTVQKYSPELRRLLKMRGEDDEGSKGVESSRTTVMGDGREGAESTDTSVMNDGREGAESQSQIERNRSASSPSTNGLNGALSQNPSSRFEKQSNRFGVVVYKRPTESSVDPPTADEVKHRSASTASTSGSGVSHKMKKKQSVELIVEDCEADVDHIELETYDGLVATGDTMALVNDTMAIVIDEQPKLKKPKLSRKHRHSVSETPPTTDDGLLMFAYLTYIQLPWYTLMDDILNNSQQPAL